MLVHAFEIHKTVISLENGTRVAEALVVDFTGNLLAGQKCLCLDLTFERREILELVDFV